MSLSAVAAPELPRRFRPPGREPVPLRVMEWAVTLPAVALVGLLSFGEREAIGRELPELAAWLAILVAMDLFPVPVFGQLVLSMSLPVLLAAGMVFSPPVVGLLALVGSLDGRELRREVTLGKALFNRAQVALAAVSASAVFHRLGGDLGSWPWVLGPALAGLGADLVVNGALVAVAEDLRTGMGLRRVATGMLGGPSLGYVLAHLSLGLLGLVLAVVFTGVGAWGLTVGPAALLLARQTFRHGARLRQAERALEAKNRALLRLSQQVAEERRQERVAIAADLHDEVLQPLYQVHLMGEVLKQDLATGRLLQLEEDLPGLLAASGAAQEALRRVVRDLRRSPLGVAGLGSAVRLLADALAGEGNVRVRVDVGPVTASALVQLLAYQVVREALRNALRHARARSIEVRVFQEAGCLRVVVEDDGVGFAPHLVDGDRHFGLQLMRERVEAAGGLFVLESSRGSGTRVLASMPLEVLPPDPSVGPRDESEDHRPHDDH